MLVYNQGITQHNRLGGVPILDTENIIDQVLINGAALADAVSEEFVLAITAAYLCGVKAGKLAAQSAA